MQEWVNRMEEIERKHENQKIRKKKLAAQRPHSALQWNYTNIYIFFVVPIVFGRFELNANNAYLSFCYNIIYYRRRSKSCERISN